MIENTNNVYNNEFWIVTSLLFGTIFIFCIIYYKKFRKNKRLKEQNIFLKNVIGEYQNSIVDKNIQLKEIHHRIKNNLQLISSLLNIQGRNSLNNFEDFIEKGQSRILSISLLHQNLYESKQNNNVNLQEYVQSLVNAVYAVYVTKSNIEIKLNANNICLDVDSAIPLGLIITELVTNAFKHAFVNRNEGTIMIDFSYNNKKSLTITIQDNGIGFPEIPLPNKSIGSELVSLLVLQLKGEIQRTNHNGTKYMIHFEKK